MIAPPPQFTLLTDSDTSQVSGVTRRFRVSSIKTSFVMISEDESAFAYQQHSLIIHACTNIIAVKREQTKQEGSKNFLYNVALHCQ